MMKKYIEMAAGSVVDSVLVLVKKEIGYMWNYKENIEKFKKEVEKLQDMKEMVEQQIDIFKRDGNDLVVGVEKWMEEAAQEISKAQEFLEQEANAKKTCFKIGICGNWATLYRYGKITTAKMTPSVLEHQERGKDFATCVSVYTRAPRPIDVYQNKELEDPVSKVIGYMWNCKENVEKFKKEVEKLKDMKERVEQQIDIAKRDGNDLVVGVEKWVEEAAQEISKGEAFLEQEANAKKTWLKIGICGNWATLRRYGKITTTKMTPSVLEHQERGKYFVTGVSVDTRAPRLLDVYQNKNLESLVTTCVSVETPAPGPIDVYQNKELEDLVTHKSALNAIIAALEDESKQIIGIYGLGGVGKTTLAKEVVTKVKHLFVDVAFTTVTQTVKAQEIRKDIENATKRIVKGEKVLIILDDVWETLDLEELCIPVNHTNCKILLTSINEDVCLKMNTQSNICVNSLPAKEAWILFKRVVGERVETDADLKPVAEEVAKECVGLPLLIKAVGSALKNKSIRSWKTALSRLKEHAPSEIDPDIQKAFTRLQLSYNYLESEEAKSCFLLCSMFPEDFDISLEALVYYMVGLHKFDHLESMEEARDRVRNAVNMLTFSCLLLNVEDRDGFTKMHDVVRDVALLIASRDINNKYLVKAGKDLTEWQARENNLRDYRGISLMMNSISKLPDYEVHLPILDIFLINTNWGLSMISDEFIKGMKEVKVLDLSRCYIAQLPQSLELLTKLRMLNLEGNYFFHDLSLLGEMKELEILNLNRTRIEEIPEEIGRLVNLRRLELVRCKEMTHVTPGVISKLRSLEELCIDFSRMREGVKGCIAEVMKLSKLTYLDLTVNSFDEISEGYLENMKRYVIRIPFFFGHVMLSRSDCYLSISSRQLSDLPDIDIQLLKWLEKMIELIRNPHISISGIHKINNINPTVNINKLEHIDVRECPNVTCLVDDGTKRWDGDEGKTEEKFFKELKTLRLNNLEKLEVLWKCPDEYISLTNLVTLSISDCDDLKSIFTVSIARSLVNLKKFYIDTCPGLHTVIWGGVSGDDKSGNIIVFPSLAEISLVNLERLGSFHSGATENCSIEYPSLVDVRIDGRLKMNIWAPGIHVTPKLKSISVVKLDDVTEFQLDGPNALNDAVKQAYETFN